MKNVFNTDIIRIKFAVVVHLYLNLNSIFFLWAYLASGKIQDSQVSGSSGEIPVENRSRSKQWNTNETMNTFYLSYPLMHLEYTQ